MDFSIIIPTYNSDKYIDNCLESIKDIDYQKDQYEIIVIDGGSTDKTLEILRNHRDILVFRSDNLSISNNRNIGAYQSNGRYLVFIDSDCIVNKKILLQAENNLKKYVCCGSFYQSSNDHGWVAKTWLIAERKETGHVNWITGGTLIIKKSIFFAISGFNENLLTEEDEDICHSIRKLGYKIYNDLSMASTHLGQADNVTIFFKKEMWRGKSIIKSVQDKGINRYSRFDIFIILCFVNYCFLLFSIFLKFQQIAYVLIGINSLIPFLLSIKKCIQIGSYKFIIKLYILYFIFILARVTSIFRIIFSFILKHFIT